MLIAGHMAGNREADFSGFYTAVLWSGGYIVSAAVFRAFGPDLAEIPFLATRPMAQVPHHFRMHEQPHSCPPDCPHW